MPTKNANARISRVHGSWRVRVPKRPAKFFSDSSYGGKQAALVAARKWRDAHWDGTNLNNKLTAKERADIRRSKEHYAATAERYNISPNYVHQLRRRDR
jgi:hypothetical protein